MTKAINADLVASGGIKDMRRTLANSPELEAAARLSIQLNSIAAEQNPNLTATMASFRRAASAVDREDRLDDEELPDVEREPDANRGEPRSTNRHANRLIAGLERGEGTAGKLLRDTLLYNDPRTW